MYGRSFAPIAAISLVLMAAALAVFPGGADASGPAPPGKELIDLNCQGIGPVTISAPTGTSNGVGQIVGAKGHGIEVASAITLTDVTTNTVLVSDSYAVGHGHAHSNQPSTTCSGVLFSGPASDYFAGGPLPLGVAPTDTIDLSLVLDVIAKL